MDPGCGFHEEDDTLELVEDARRAGTLDQDLSYLERFQSTAQAGMQTFSYEVHVKLGMELIALRKQEFNQRLDAEELGERLKRRAELRNVLKQVAKEENWVQYPDGDPRAPKPLPPPPPEEPKPEEETSEEPAPAEAPQPNPEEVRKQRQEAAFQKYQEKKAKQAAINARYAFGAYTHEGKPPPAPKPAPAAPQEGSGGSAARIMLALPDGIDARTGSLTAAIKSRRSSTGAPVHGHRLGSPVGRRRGSGAGGRQRMSTVSEDSGVEGFGTPRRGAEGSEGGEPHYEGGKALGIEDYATFAVDEHEAAAFGRIDSTDSEAAHHHHNQQQHEAEERALNNAAALLGLGGTTMGGGMRRRAGSGRAPRPVSRAAFAGALDSDENGNGAAAQHGGSGGSERATGDGEAAASSSASASGISRAGLSEWRSIIMRTRSIATSSVGSTAVPLPIHVSIPDTSPAAKELQAAVAALAAVTDEQVAAATAAAAGSSLLDSHATRLDLAITAYKHVFGTKLATIQTNMELAAEIQAYKDWIPERAAAAALRDQLRGLAARLEALRGAADPAAAPALARLAGQAAALVPALEGLEADVGDAEADAQERVAERERRRAALAIIEQQCVQLAEEMAEKEEAERLASLMAAEEEAERRMREAKNEDEAKKHARMAALLMGEEEWLLEREARLAVLHAAERDLSHLQLLRQHEEERLRKAGAPGAGSEVLRELMQLEEGAQREVKARFGDYEEAGQHIERLQEMRVRMQKRQAEEDAQQAAEDADAAAAAAPAAAVAATEVAAAAAAEAASVEAPLPEGAAGPGAEAGEASQPPPHEAAGHEQEQAQQPAAEEEPPARPPASAGSADALFEHLSRMAMQAANEAALSEASAASAARVAAARAALDQVAAMREAMGAHSAELHSMFLSEREADELRQQVERERARLQASLKAESDAAKRTWLESVLAECNALYGKLSESDSEAMGAAGQACQAATRGALQALTAAMVSPGAAAAAEAAQRLAAACMTVEAAAGMGAAERAAKLEADAAAAREEAARLRAAISTEEDPERKQHLEQELLHAEARLGGKEPPTAGHGGADGHAPGDEGVASSMPSSASFGPSGESASAGLQQQQTPRLLALQPAASMPLLAAPSSPRGPLAPLVVPPGSRPGSRPASGGRMSMPTAPQDHQQGGSGDDEAAKQQQQHQRRSLYDLPHGPERVVVPSARARASVPTLPPTVIIGFEGTPGSPSSASVSYTMPVAHTHSQQRGAPAEHSVSASGVPPSGPSAVRAAAHDGPHQHQRVPLQVKLFPLIGGEGSPSHNRHQAADSMPNGLPHHPPGAGRGSSNDFTLPPISSPSASAQLSGEGLPRAFAADAAPGVPRHSLNGLTGAAGTHGSASALAAMANGSGATGAGLSAEPYAEGEGYGTNGALLPPPGRRPPHVATQQQQQSPEDGEGGPQGTPAGGLVPMGDMAYGQWVSVPRDAPAKVHEAARQVDEVLSRLPPELHLVLLSAAELLAAAGPEAVAMAAAARYGAPGGVPGLDGISTHLAALPPPVSSHIVTHLQRVYEAKRQQQAAQGDAAAAQAAPGPSAVQEAAAAGRSSAALMQLLPDLHKVAESVAQLKHASSGQARGGSSGAGGGAGGAPGAHGAAGASSEGSLQGGQLPRGGLMGSALRSVKGRGTGPGAGGGGGGGRHHAGAGKGPAPGTLEYERLRQQQEQLAAIDRWTIKGMQVGAGLVVGAASPSGHRSPGARGPARAPVFPPLQGPKRASGGA